MGKAIFDLDEYAALARQAAAEGTVLLKNHREALPLKKGTKAAVFGRSQFNYYKSGTGSGGLVNTRYVVSILNALQQEEGIELNQNVLSVYQNWIQENPFDEGKGWASEPWCQKEMEVLEDLAANAGRESDTAIIILGRTAGEDKDNSAQPGSYLLTCEEENMLEKVCRNFSRSVVLLNVGNIIDMKWVEKYNPSAVLYVWQGGQEGGRGVLDVLTGRVNPCGKLSDTIAEDISDYPSAGHFGHHEQNIYAEDIYVGYRYFETFAPKKALYPFGSGLSYTTFTIVTGTLQETGDTIQWKGVVTNTGRTPGKEVVQIYVQAPQGKLGKPARSLCGFAKTGVIAPGSQEEVTVEWSKYQMASFDDSGVTGYEACFVCEEGKYRIYAGANVRDAALAGSIRLDQLQVIRKLKSAMSPVKEFTRMKPAIEDNAGRTEPYRITWEAAPLRKYDMSARVKEHLPEDIPYTGDKGWKLEDVFTGNVTMEGFIAQLSEEDLCCISRGEGMCSSKVTPGTAGAFGGITRQLKDFGIPAGCCADGPSGIRMDCGTIAFSLPNGTCLACTFNEELSVKLFEMTGLELRKNRVDTLLGPGMNLHRNPLNGRNFEYFSEDPLLTGKMAAAQLKGMHKYGVTGTIKHFACNNQEYKRHETEGIISQRALREIYLRGYEIAVKEAGAYSIMSTYGPVNGLWTASSFDLLTTILREEWGYQGLVMTDWWAKGNDEGGTGTSSNAAAMIRCQNDLYMVTTDPEGNSNKDNLMESLRAGTLTRGQLQRSAMNLCRVLMKFPAFSRFCGREELLDRQLAECLTEEEAAILELKNIPVDQEAEIDLNTIKTDKGSINVYQIACKERGYYELTMSLRTNSHSTLAQIPMSVTKDKELVETVSLSGADCQWVVKTMDLGLVTNPNFYLKLYFAQSGMEIAECRIRLKKALKD